jgi:phosphoglycolate phosphatase
MQPRLVLFDCDGTLIDSAAVIVGAMAAAFERHDLAVPPEAEIRAIIGLSLPTAVATLAAHHPEAPVAELVKAYKAAYRDAATREAAHEPLFPGITEAIDRIGNDHTLLGVVTGKSRAGLSRVLAAHGLADRFVVTRTADDAPSKPAPDMVLQAVTETGADAERTLVIGDTSFDMAMARAAGACGIGVGWGYHPVEELRRVGAHAVALSAAELPALVDRAFHRR